MKTAKNLMSAFTGEAEANRKYLAYAVQAEKEGFTNVARIMRAIAEAETIHAHKHLEVAGKIGSTQENLDDAIAGEQYEYTTMYPEFIEDAKAENQQKALKSFEFANEAEKVHGKTFSIMKEVVAQGKDMEEAEINLCPVCGWVGVGEPPERCPICNVPAKMFKKY